MTIADRDCAPNYLANMSKPLRDGMTTSVTNWGSSSIDMSWLDQETGCQEACSNDPTIGISNLVYKTKTPTGPTPDQKPCPAPSPYVYGDPCGSNSCTETCSDAACDWSWPVNDPAKWASKDAGCRCNADKMFTF
jgi:hypothetical protein